MDLSGRWSWLGFSPLPVVPVSETCFLSLTAPTPSQNKLRRYRRVVEERSAQLLSRSAYNAETRLPPPPRGTPVPTSAVVMRDLRRKNRERFFKPQGAIGTASLKSVTPSAASSCKASAVQSRCNTCSPWSDPVTPSSPRKPRPQGAQKRASPVNWSPEDVGDSSTLGGGAVQWEDDTIEYLSGVEYLCGGPVNVGTFRSVTGAVSEKMPGVGIKQLRVIPPESEEEARAPPYGGSGPLPGEIEMLPALAPAKNDSERGHQRYMY